MRRPKLILAAEIVIVYVRVRWLMRHRDIRDVVSAVRSSVPQRLGGVESESVEPRLVALRLGVAVQRTLNLLPTDSRCLVQSLVLLRLLAARAISSTLVIGARSAPRFDAHAWVEQDGLPVLPPQGFEDLRLVEI